MTDLRLCLEDCYYDGRTDKLTSCTMNTWHVGKQCALVHSRAQIIICHKDTKLYNNSNLINMTGPVKANQEEQVGEEPRLVVEDGVSMVEDLAEKSQEMLLPSRRLRSAQVIENFVDTLSGPSNQSSSQGELSVGIMVGQRRMVRQEGMVSTKTRLAISTMVGDVGSMVVCLPTRVSYRYGKMDSNGSNTGLGAWWLHDDGFLNQINYKRKVWALWRGQSSPWRWVSA